MDRGYVRPEDEAASGDPEGGVGDQADADGADESSPAAPAVHRAVITIGGEALPAEDEDDAIAPLPERLLIELTAHRTLALRDAVAKNPHVAMTALLHKLCLDTFWHGASDGCLEASVRHVFFPVQAADLKESTVRQGGRRAPRGLESRPAQGRRRALGLALGSRRGSPGHAAGALRLFRGQRSPREGRPSWRPGDFERRRSAPHPGGGPARHALLASIWSRLAGGRRLENYLGRVTKPRILEAVREARGEDSVRLIDHLKKADMAKEAERLLDGTGWLPEPLRGAGLDDAPDAPSEDSDALPEFLIGDDGDERRQRGGRRVRARRHGRRMRQRRAGHVPLATFPRFPSFPPESPAPRRASSF